MKKNVAIVFGITKDYVFALANVLIGMKKHCSRFWDDIIVYHDGVMEEDIEKISTILECRFILYDTSSISKESKKESVKAYSYMALARFECFDLLHDYKYVIWHDVDILIQKDFKELLQTADSSGMALTCNPQFYGEQNFYQLISEYDLLKPLYNSGLMVLKDNLQNFPKMRKYCYDKFNKYADKIRYLDQAVLNIMIQDYGIKVRNISLSEYCCHPSELNCSNASIIHAYGRDKFWNSMELKIQFSEWVSNDEEWERICTGMIRHKPKTYAEASDYPRVSIIMSIYERIDFVDEAIESILSQTFSDFEFLIVLEKSPNQGEIKNTLEKRYIDKRIRVICNDERLGFAASLNVGFEQARGEYIARMDDDDIALPQRLEKEVEFLDNNKDISVVGTYIKMFMNCNNVCTVPATHKELEVRALTETPIYHPTVMFRKDDFKRHGLKYDTNYMTEDYELWCRALKVVKFANIQEVLLLYRASGQNATATQGGGSIRFACGNC